MRLIIALGNPGREYEKTRHNAGWLALDKLIAQENLIGKKLPKAHSEVFDLKIEREKILLAKPQTFMNDSGLAVMELMKFYKLTNNDIIVIHDDKDIPVGNIRVQTDRGAAGHNGIKSVIERLGTKDFTRIRIGVGPIGEEKIQVISNFVLNKFTKEEFKVLQTGLDSTIKEIKRLSLVA